MFCFFFSSRRRHTRYIGDWSSDVCSSDLCPNPTFVNGSQHAAEVMAFATSIWKADVADHWALPGVAYPAIVHQKYRSEERRVGKECRTRWSPDHKKIKGV